MKWLEEIKFRLMGVTPGPMAHHYEEDVPRLIEAIEKALRALEHMQYQPTNEAAKRLYEETLKSIESLGEE
jgi:hypothetical protein